MLSVHNHERVQVEVAEYHQVAAGLAAAQQQNGSATPISPVPPEMA
jgi:hypothetical protein